MKPGALLFVFGWPAAIGLSSLAGLALALFVDGAWDIAAVAIIAAPLLLAVGASFTATRRASNRGGEAPSRASAGRP